MKVQKFSEIFEPPITAPPKIERKSQFDRIAIDPRQKALAKLMKIELKLSEKLFWFEVPLVCRWEPWEESDEFHELEEETKDYNLRYADYVKREEEKLFSSPDPGHYKKVLQLDDFDLNSEEKSVKLQTLFKHYIVPMMPDEYKCFHEQIELFEQRQREWQMILDAKEDRNFDVKEIFEETKMKFDISAITREEFDTLFEEKLYHPRNLFPKEHQNLIEILKASDTSLPIEKMVEKISVEGKTPDKNAAYLLSELVKQIETVKDILRPFFREIPEEAVIQFEAERPRDFRTSQFSAWRENRASRLSRQFREQEVAHRPIRTRSRPTNLKPTTSASTRSVATSTETETTTSNPFPKKAPPKLIAHNQGKWSTKEIHDESYDKDKKTIIFYASRLGTFGQAARKYVNLPFKSWEIFPVTENSQQFVKLKLETQHVTIEFRITCDGYTFQITSPVKVPFFEIKNPVKVFELKKLLSSLNLNVFPENDASCYVKDISEKHKPMELHTYKSMAVYCLSHHFKSTVWNRFADRRVAVFESRVISKSDFKLMMATPLKTASVTVREKCTPLDVVELDYEMIPPDQQVACSVKLFAN